MPKDKINLLMVDDELQFLQSMAKRLEARGFNVIAVHCGDEAIEAARKHPVDIAIVDLKMPGLDGGQTLQVLLKEHKCLQVVILTGHGSFLSALHFAEKGVYHYVQKPCDLDRLLVVLTEAYKRRLTKKLNMSRTDFEKALAGLDDSEPMAVLERMKELD